MATKKVAANGPAKDFNMNFEEVFKWATLRERVRNYLIKNLLHGADH